MALSKVVLTIRDTENGDISLDATFDPPCNSEEETTPAQSVAMGILMKLQAEDVEPHLAPLESSGDNLEPEEHGDSNE